MTLTDAAIAILLRVRETEADYIRDNDLVLAIGWCLNRKNDWNNPGPGLGFLERSKVTADGRIPCEAIELYNNLPVDIGRKYTDATLDYADECLNFI